MNKKRTYGKQKRITLDEFTISEMRAFLKATGEPEEFPRDIERMPLFIGSSEMTEELEECLDGK